MPQPDSSRNGARDARWSEPNRPWPVDPAAPHRFRARLGPAVERPKPEPEKDGRTPDDKDGNEELEREVKEKPPTRHSASDREASGRAWRDFETEDTGEWVATERFTLDDELDDTWPNVPARYLDD